MTIRGFDLNEREQAERAYVALNNSAMQQRIRSERRWFVGAVYWQPGDYCRDELLRELRRMRALGFTVVRFHTCKPRELAPGVYDFTRTDDWLDCAAEAGLGVFLHLDDQPQPSDAVLAHHHLDRTSYNELLPDDPRVEAVLETFLAPIVEHCRHHPALYAWGLFGEPGIGAQNLHSEAESQRFAVWLEAQYGTIAALDHAWNIYPECDTPIVPSFGEAPKLVEGITVGLNGVELGGRCYGAVRDLMRFQTDIILARIGRMIAFLRRYDTEHPITVGAHQLFLNQPQQRWDNGAWARLGDLHFSSIHPSWHFESVAGEIDRPVYMQARMTRDYFKGGWTSAFETTGGPVQYSGGYGNAMTPGLMRRLMLSYLAAGNINIAFWTWNARPGGWEAGEYGLTTLSGAISPWAQEAGRVAHGIEQYHAELWQATQKPHVAILQSWDTEAILLLEPERHDLQTEPGRFSRGTRSQAGRANIGLARALINHHIPFEYITESELLAGIAAVYPVIYVAHARALSDTIIAALNKYMESGGHVIADIQVGFLDQWGKLRKTGSTSQQAQLFGAFVETIHDTRTNDLNVNGNAIEGFYGDITPTDARVLIRFDNGTAAVTEVRRGRGVGTLIGFDAARMCWQPGCDHVESLIARLVRGNQPPTWTCEASLAFRLMTPQTEHFFLINDGPARTIMLYVYDRQYTKGKDVISGQPISVDGTICLELQAGSAVWARFECSD